MEGFSVAYDIAIIFLTQNLVFIITAHHAVALVIVARR